MAKTLFLLLLVVCVSALQYFGITIIVDTLDNIPMWAIILSTALVTNSLTACIFSMLTGIEQKLEIAKLRLRVVKAEVNPLKDLVELMTILHKQEVERAAVGIELNLDPIEETTTVDPSATIQNEKDAPE